MRGGILQNSENCDDLNFTVNTEKLFIFTADYFICLSSYNKRTLLVSNVTGAILKNQIYLSQLTLRWQAELVKVESVVTFNKRNNFLLEKYR